MFTLLIYKHVVGRDKEYNWVLYLIINLCLWFLLPAFGQNILWLVGACNYLWGATLVLLFLLPIRFYIDNKTYSNSIFLVIGMFLLGILAGWTNENNSAAMVACVLLFLIYRIYNKQKIAYWHISGFIGALVGFLILILAPGNHVRSEEFANDFSFIKNIYNRFLSINNCFVEYLTSALIILIIVSILAHFHGKYKGKKILLNSIYVIGSFLGIYSMLLSPTFPDRAWMGPITFLIISIGYSYNCLNFKLEVIKKLQFFTISTIVVIFIINLYSSYIDIRGVYLSWNNRINSINLGDKKDFTFDEIISNNKHTSAYGLEDISEDPNSNKLVAAYFNINSIKKLKKC